MCACVHACVHPLLCVVQNETGLFLQVRHLTVKQARAHDTQIPTRTPTLLHVSPSCAREDSRTAPLPPVPPVPPERMEPHHDAHGLPHQNLRASNRELERAVRVGEAHHSGTLGALVHAAHTRACKHIHTTHCRPGSAATSRNAKRSNYRSTAALLDAVCMLAAHLWLPVALSLHCAPLWNTCIFCPSQRVGPSVCERSDRDIKREKDRERQRDIKRRENGSLCGGARLVRETTMKRCRQ